MFILGDRTGIRFGGQDLALSAGAVQDGPVHLFGHHHAGEEAEMKVRVIICAEDGEVLDDLNVSFVGVEENTSSTTINDLSNEIHEHIGMKFEIEE